MQVFKDTYIIHMLYLGKFIKFKAINPLLEKCKATKKGETSIMILDGVGLEP